MLLLAFADNWRKFQSSPAPRGGCNVHLASVTHKVGEVSILTRPERRMQLGLLATIFLDVPVSILTRPERRMQQHPALRRRGDPLSFNPHPPREADATRRLYE